jgi:hypothetical protein
MKINKFNLVQSQELQFVCGRLLIICPACNIFISTEQTQEGGEGWDTKRGGGGFTSWPAWSLWRTRSGRSGLG